MAFNPLPLNTGSSGNTLASDSRSVDALRARAARDPKGAIRETAKQFESLFMQEVMKSMRATTMSSGLMENAATQMGTEMLDTQFAGKLSGLPGGLSDAIARQLQRQMGVSDSSKTSGANGLPILATKGVPAHVQSFIQKHDSAAKEAQTATGIPASFMLAQAAHESGWGKREITNKDGSPSFNVFGIKATPGWTGKVTEVQTTEYVDGKPQKVSAKFRAYDSYADAFKDYARLLGSNERYREVVAQANRGNAETFARGLQKAGYATDPEYADKLTRVINTTVRVQRAMA